MKIIYISLLLCASCDNDKISLTIKPKAAGEIVEIQHAAPEMEVESAEILNDLSQPLIPGETLNFYLKLKTAASLQLAGGTSEHLSVSVSINGQIKLLECIPDTSDANACRATYTLTAEDVPEDGQLSAITIDGIGRSGEGQQIRKLLNKIAIKGADNLSIASSKALLKYTLTELRPSFTSAVINSKISGIGVRITNGRDKKPVSGSLVICEVTQGEAKFDTHNQKESNSKGESFCPTLTIGKTASDIKIKISLKQDAETSVSFIIPKAVLSISITGGNYQTQPASTILADPLTVSVTDQFSSSLQNPRIRWTVQSGDGSIMAEADSRNVKFELGSARGFDNNLVRATLIDYPSLFVDFTLSGTADAVAVSTTPDFGCAVLRDGSAMCWGLNYNGELGNGNYQTSFIPTPVIGLAGAIVKLETGNNHACAIIKGGAVQCWGKVLGNGTYGFSNVPVSPLLPPGSKALDLSASRFEACVLLDTGSIYCWGLTPSPALVADISSAIQLSVGYDGHSCAVLANGTVQCWGYNGYGQLGNGSKITSNTPVSIIGINNAIAVATTNNVSCAALQTGAVKCWGYNGRMELGIPTDQLAESLEPVLVPNLNKVVTLAKGWSTTCAITENQEAYCWGSPHTSSQALHSLGYKNAISISQGAGSNMCLALRNGSVECSGSNRYGATGYQSSFNPDPTPISDKSDFTSLAFKYGTLCGVHADATVSCLGSNVDGNFGSGDTNNAMTPVATMGLSGVIQVKSGLNSSSSHHSCALLSDRTLACWGANASGELGDGTTTSRLTPAAVAGVSNVFDFAVGGSFSCAIIDEGNAAVTGGRITCWGSNSSGYLGRGSSGAGVFAPDYVATISNAKSITAGARHVCASTADKKVYCWGYNAYGALGTKTTVWGSRNTPTLVLNEDNSELSDITRVDANNHTTCGVTSSGTVKCWGKDASLQINAEPLPAGQVGSTANKNYAVDITGLNSVTSVSVGYGQLCALIANGTIQCWGDNTDGALGLNGHPANQGPALVSGLSNVLAVAAGYKATCALFTNGGLKCWGAIQGLLIPTVPTKIEFSKITFPPQRT